MEEAADDYINENLKLCAACREKFGAESDIQKDRNGIFRSCNKM